MFIEDLLQLLTGTGKYLFQTNNIITGHDGQVLYSIADRLGYNTGGALTEKQANLVIKLLSKHRNVIYSAVPDIDKHINNPQWRSPFRVIPQEKSITVDIKENRLCVRFPYDNDLVESLRKRNQEVHEIHKGIWDGESKGWVFPLTETTVEWIGTNLLSRSFQADDTFLELYKNVVDVVATVENHLPMLAVEGGRYVLKNCHHKIPQPTTGDVVEALFHARDYGITCWDDTVEEEIANINPVTKAVITAAKSKHPWVDSGIHAIDSFADLLAYGGPAIVIIPGGSELQELVKWVDFAKTVDIDTKHISVMFRLPNEQADFNNYVRDQELNNPLDDSTRLVFVSTKITKPLVKSGIKFSTVINLGYYNYMHFTMSTVVDNARNLVYYSMKAPTQQKRWRPHELS